MSGIDFNGDGIADPTYDLVGADGVGDTAPAGNLVHMDLMRADGTVGPDGYFETVATNYDDGFADQIWADRNADGRHDLQILVNGAGYGVPIAEDSNLDGVFEVLPAGHEHYKPQAGVVRPDSNVEFQAGWSNQQMLDHISDNQKLINSNVFGNGDIDNDGKQNYADDYHSNL